MIYLARQHYGACYLMPVPVPVARDLLRSHSTSFHDLTKGHYNIQVRTCFTGKADNALAYAKTHGIPAPGTSTWTVSI